MKKIINLIIFSIFISSCWSKDDGRFPYKNTEISIKKIKLYRGFITINDTLSFSGGYYQKKGTFDNKEEERKKECLEGNLHVNDILITDGNPKDYVIRRRDGIDTKFYTWPLNEN